PAPGPPVRGGDPRDRLVPAFRPGVRPDRRRARRRHPHRRPAPLRDGLSELLPVRRRVGHGVGALRDHPGVLGAPVPTPARAHPVLSMASPRARDADLSRIALTAGLLALAALWLVPTLWVLVTSLKRSADIIRLPPEWIPWPPTLEHYGEVLFSRSRTARLGPALAHTLVMSAGAGGVLLVG